MEVHPPHEPVHSWRDALIHIGLMTVGLFIALSLEGLIEYTHHRHLVHEARENIRAELEANHKSTLQNIVDLGKEERNIAAGIETIQNLQKHPGSHGSMNFTWTYATLSDAAWRSARDTGALGYMPFATVQQLATLYGEQTLLAERMHNLQFHEAELIAPMAAKNDTDPLPTAEYDAALTDAARTQVDLGVLGQMLKGLDQILTEDLQKL